MIKKETPLTVAQETRDLMKQLINVLAGGKFAIPVKPFCSKDGRFIDNGDGTVTDTKTKLIWVKNPHTDLPEQFKKELTWQDAVNACKGLSFAGHKDWRLPTREELFSLTDDTSRDPAINKEMFPDTRSNWYWTATELAGSSVLAWVVDFDDGYVSGYRKGIDGYVRPVRSSQ